MFGGAQRVEVEGRLSHKSQQHEQHKRARHLRAASLDRWAPVVGSVLGAAAVGAGCCPAGALSVSAGAADAALEPVCPAVSRIHHATVQETRKKPGVQVESALPGAWTANRLISIDNCLT